MMTIRKRSQRHFACARTALHLYALTCRPLIVQFEIAGENVEERFDSADESNEVREA